MVDVTDIPMKQLVEFVEYITSEFEKQRKKKKKKKKFIRAYLIT